MQKVEGPNLKPAPSAEQLRPQSDKIAQPVTVKKPAFKLKTAPVFIQPQDLQVIARRGPVSLRLNGVEDKDQLDWQIEYKKFGTKQYSRSRMARPQVAGGNNQVTGSFHATQEGDYRMRVRSKEKGSQWSQWRLFRVGNPDVKKIETHSLRSTVKKPAAADDVIPEGKEPEIKPTVKEEKPRLIQPAGPNYKPRIRNNS